MTSFTRFLLPVAVFAMGTAMAVPAEAQRILGRFGQGQLRSRIQEQAQTYADRVGEFARDQLGTGQTITGQQGQTYTGQFTDQYGRTYTQQYGQPTTQQDGQTYTRQYGQPTTRQYGQTYTRQYSQPSTRQYGQTYNWQYEQPTTRQFDQQQYDVDQEQFDQTYTQQQIDRQQRELDEGRQQFDRDRQEFDRERQQFDQQQSAGQYDRQQEGRQRDQMQGYQMEPVGVVRIGLDYNDDGEADAYQYIYAMDLEQARQASRRRMQQEGTERQIMERQQTAQREQMRQQPIRLRGRLQDLKAIRLVNDQPHLVARVETESGRLTNVDLGPVQGLRDLRPREGEQVEIIGNPGRIDEKPILMARAIRTQRGEAQLQRPQPQGRQKFDAQLQGIRTARLRGIDEPMIVGQARVDGRTLPVILGPASKLRALDLQRGDAVAMIGHTGRLNGETALVADALAANGQVVEIRATDDQQRFRTQSRQQGQQPVYRRSPR